VRRKDKKWIGGPDGSSPCENPGLGSAVENDRACGFYGPVPEIRADRARFRN